MPKEPMTRSAAVKLVARVAWATAKIRSNIIEAISSHGTSLDELSDGFRLMLQNLYPTLFPGEGKISLIEVLSKLQEKGDDIEPIDLYNLILLIERNETLPFMLDIFYRDGKRLPRIEPMPKWLSGWEAEQNETNHP